MDRTTWILVGVVGFAALVTLYFMQRGEPPAPPPVVETAVEPPPPAEEPPPPAPEPPAPPPVSETEPPQPTVPLPAEVELPPLDDSDRETRQALAEAVGDRPVESFLVPSQVVRKLVVTVDNLPGDKVALRLRAVEPIPESFVADGNIDDGYTLSEDNFERYGRFVRAIDAVDPEQLAAAYFRYYPLLQEAYEELGYPGRQFHARVIAVIDDMLAAPQPSGPIELVRPKVMYQFADPALESLSAGQKMMIRMGPDNAYIVKAKLRELRAVLTGATPAE
jgi:hypothetical protein